MPRLISAVITPLIVVLMFPLIVFAALTGKGGTCDNPIPTSTTMWDGEQLDNASLVIEVGRKKNVPTWGQVIAVAVAMQESKLRNLPDGTGDSIGLFQQRPSQGWGTPHQLTSPAYQASQFFDALKAIPHWATLPLTVAAQNVQRSSTPDDYAQWTDAAFNLVVQNPGTKPASPTDRVPSGPACQDDEGDGLQNGPLALPQDHTLLADTSQEAASAITWALQQLGTPYSYGGDCTAPHSANPAHQCDCSSLVQQAYRGAAHPLPRTTSEQVHAGFAVPPNELAPGDLVFIPGSEGTFNAPRHVGIYIGDDLIIHAPHSGARVRLAHLSTWNPVAAIRRVT